MVYLYLQLQLDWDLLRCQTPLSHYLEPFSHGSYRNYCSTSGKPIIPPSFILQKQQFQGSLPNELAYLGQLEVVCFGLNSFSGLLPSWLESLPKIPNDLFYNHELGILIPIFSSHACCVTHLFEFFFFLKLILNVSTVGSQIVNNLFFFLFFFFFAVSHIIIFHPSLNIMDHFDIITKG